MAAKKTSKTAAPAPAPAKKAVKKVAKKSASKKTAVKAAAKTTKPAAKPGFDEIAKTAYLIYRQRLALGLPGTQESDWLQAEKQLKG